MKVKFTYIGTATVLIEIGDQNPIRLLTDPAFDPSGKYYRFKFGTGSRKTKDPALQISQLPKIDAVLLSHDEHADNLDDAGRKMLPLATRVLTTKSGAKRLNKDLGDKVTGLDPWEKTSILTQEGWPLTIHATPARHIQAPLPVFLCGDTLGFILEWPGQKQGSLYISGDTVFFKGIEEISQRFQVGTALLHLGGVSFGMSGPIRYTFTGKGAAQAIKTLKPQTVIPIHYEGWTHFHESLQESEKVLEAEGHAQQIIHLPAGQALELDL